MFKDLFNRCHCQVLNIFSTMQNGSFSLSDDFLSSLTIFMLACFIGYYVVLKVSPALHAPLMSITNAVSGIIIIGSLIVTDFKILRLMSYIGLISIFLAAINIFGGVVITYRMLSMFKTSKTKSKI